jgi:striatin 1/3/4
MRTVVSFPPPMCASNRRYIDGLPGNESGQCTYTMLAHTASISSLALSPDGRELVSAGHDASLMREEGVCAVVWSADGRWVVSGGGDGIVKVFAR